MSAGLPRGQGHLSSSSLKMTLMLFKRVNFMDLKKSIHVKGPIPCCWVRRWNVIDEQRPLDTGCFDLVASDRKLLEAGR